MIHLLPTMCAATTVIVLLLVCCAPRVERLQRND
jgi:hypothetical protein